MSARVLVTALVPLIAWLAPAQAAASCPCPLPATPDALKTAKAVFEGRVVEVERRGASELRIVFAVVRSFKGVERERVELTMPAEPDSCDPRFERDQSYLVFARTAPEGPADALTTTRCDGTQPMAEARPALAQLGMGMTPFEPRAAAAKEEKASPPARGGCASCTIGPTARSTELVPAGAILLPIVLLAWRRSRPRVRNR